LPGILVVERSTTLNHLLKRTLTAAGITARGELANYFEAIDLLRRSAELERPFGLLLVGAPGRMTREFSALLDYLRSPDGAVLPVVLMTHEMLPEFEEFSRTRPNLNTMLWANFGRLPGIIRAQLPAGVEPPLLAATPNGVLPPTASISCSSTIRTACAWPTNSCSSTTASRLLPPARSARRRRRRRRRTTTW
jgi:hypothetical protein